MDKIFIIIAAYNEANRILSVLKKLKTEYHNIVVIDDGSSDETSKIVKDEGIKVLKHIVNLGKGAAMKTGCDYAISKGAEIIVLIDADGQHKPEDIPRFLESLKGTDIVFGYRKIGESMPFILRFGNKFINLTTKILFRINIQDTQCGFRAMRSETYKKIKWKSTGYPAESEMVALVGKKRLKYKEIPIRTIYGNRHKGTTMLDGLKIVFNMVLWRLWW